MSLDAIGAEPPPHYIDAEAQPYCTTSPDVEWGLMHIGLGIVLTQLIFTDDVTKDLCYNTRLLRRQRTSHLSLALCTNAASVGTSGAAYMPCYAPDGSLMQGTAAQPCNQIQGTFSTCCATDLTSKPGVVQDICTTNGLCQNYWTYYSGQRLLTYWRGGCSDPTWNSPFCLKGVCVDDNVSHLFAAITLELMQTQQHRDWSQTVQNCTDGTWCCRADEAASCCSNNAVTKFRLAPIIGVSPSSAVSTTTLSTSPSTPNAARSPSSTQAAPSAGLSTGAKAGIGTGVALGFVALITIVLTMWRRKRIRNSSADTYRYDGKPELEARDVARRNDDMTTAINDPAGGEMHELHGGARLAELPTRTTHHS